MLDRKESEVVKTVHTRLLVGYDGVQFNHSSITTSIVLELYYVINCTKLRFPSALAATALFVDLQGSTSNITALTSFGGK